MTTQNIVNNIKEHLMQDTGYKLFRSDKSENGFVLAENVTFDMTNKKPDNHFAPYFKIQSVDQGKHIFQSIYSSISNKELEDLFSNVMATKNVDFSRDVFFAIFRPDRL